MNDKTKNRIAYLESLGLVSSDLKIWHRKWLNATRDDGELNFEQYIQLAVDAGIKYPNQIGTELGNYQLGRFGDEGLHTSGNCRFITVEQNRQERTDNGKGASGIEIMASLKRGKTKYNDASLLSASIKMTGRTKINHKGVKDAANKRSKTFRVISPSGEVFEGRNLNEFCKENNLLQCSMSEVCRGQQKAHKGWSGEYIYA